MTINYKFYLRFVLPAMVAMVLFIVSIFAFIIPHFENTMLEAKKEMTSELTQAAWSVLDEYQIKVEADSLSLDVAQAEAAAVIELMRYGAENKDYFWIIDQHPKMVMHPYRPEMNGQDLTDYKDPEGKLLFNEAVGLVEEQGEGYIEYIWQWKDDPARLVPKLSYVQAYPKWGWIIGTGIYLDDVQEEIHTLRARLMRISAIIIGVICLMLVFIVRQSLTVEGQRRKAEEGLRQSRQKYKSLVEASTEGTIMLMKRKIVFANMRFTKMIGCTTNKIYQQRFEEIFECSWHDVQIRFSDPNKSVIIETRLKPCGAEAADVILSISQVDYLGDKGYIVVAKNVSRQKRLEKGTAELNRDLQMALLLMNQPISGYVKELTKCFPNTSIREAARLMESQKQKALFIDYHGDIIGVVDEGDMRSRAIAAGLDMEANVSVIMTSPVQSISQEALLYEAALLFKDKGISHILVTNKQGDAVGVLNNVDVLSLQQNTLNFTLREIQAAENTAALERISANTPVLVQALLDSGDKTANINHVITSVSDALTHRLLELCIQKVGAPPCKFAFVALGSEGRKEQTLATDQDNAIIFEDLPEREDQDKLYRYFQRLAKEVNAQLNKLGYQYCKGDVMAMNPKWTQPLSVWKEYFSDWIKNSDPQSILDSSIFFDLRTVYGDNKLASELLTHIHAEVLHQAVFYQHMANPIIKFKAPVGMFGGIVGDAEAGEGKLIDIKKIQLPVIGFARLYALKHQLKETNTLMRIQKLQELGYINEQLGRELSVSYGMLMQLRLRFQAQSIADNRPPDNRVDVNALSQVEQTALKKVLSEMANLQTQLSFDFKGGV